VASQNFKSSPATNAVAKATVMLKESWLNKEESVMAAEFRPSATMAAWLKPTPP
jgi:hypothetical protein